MSQGILLFIGQRDGVLNRTSLEAMVAAQGIASVTGEKVSAVVLGKSIGGVASEIASKKLEAVHTGRTTRSRVHSGWLRACLTGYREVDPL